MACGALLHLQDTLFVEAANFRSTFHYHMMYSNVAVMSMDVSNRNRFCVTQRALVLRCVVCVGLAARHCFEVRNAVATRHGARTGATGS